LSAGNNGTNGCRYGNTIANDTNGIPNINFTLITRISANFYKRDQSSRWIGRNCSADSAEPSGGRDDTSDKLSSSRNY